MEQNRTESVNSSLTAMAKPWRPASEHFQSDQSLVASSHETQIEEEEEEEEDQAPIFSHSKSSVDVLMAAEPRHKRDPAWTRMDMRRSSSTNTHAEQNSFTLQQLHARTTQHADTRNFHQASHIAQHTQTHSSPRRSERWAANVERWSLCSLSALSDRSTSETVVWRGGSMRPWSQTQEDLWSAAPDSPLSKLASSATTPSPFISPLQTPPMSLASFYLPSPLTLPPHTHQQEGTSTPSITSTPLQSPIQASPEASLQLSPLVANSLELSQLAGVEDECSAQICSPLSPLIPLLPVRPTPSSINLEEEGVFESASPESGHLVGSAAETPPCLTFSPGSTQSLGEGVGSPVDAQEFTSSPPTSPPDRQEPKGGASVCHLEGPLQLGPICPTGLCSPRSWRSPLVSSWSDSLLDDYCRCSSSQSGIEITTFMTSPRAPKRHVFKEEATLEEGTMTSQLELVDAAVQTVSPQGSWWNLKQNMSYLSYSHMGSHSILGSPPGSRLNLRSSLGSNSNLVSPSSSMFQVESGEEEAEEQDGDAALDASSPLTHSRGRRRSCLKIQGEERQRSGEKEEFGRRSSMKQVQWDEDGMTWDVYGASLNPEELTTAIQKHLELQRHKGTESLHSAKSKSKKKTTSKVPLTPLVITTVKVMSPEPSPPVMVDNATSMVEGEVMPEEVVASEGELEQEGSKKEEPTADVGGNSEAKGEIKREEGEGEEEELHGEEGTPLRRKSSNRGSGRSSKKSVMKSLKRPGWCGGSKKADS